MLVGLAGRLLAAEEERVGAGGLAEGELVEGEALAAGLLDAGARGAGEAQGGDRQLGDLVEADVVGDGADDDDRVVGGDGLARLGDLAGDARDRDRRAVRLAHVQAAEDDLVEARVGAAGEEAVKLWGAQLVSEDRATLALPKESSGEGDEAHLDKEEEVRVLRLGRRAVALLDVVALNVDSLFAPERRKRGKGRRGGEGGRRRGGARQSVGQLGAPGLFLVSMCPS